MHKKSNLGRVEEVFGTRRDNLPIEPQLQKAIQEWLDNPNEFLILHGLNDLLTRQVCFDSYLYLLDKNVDVRAFEERQFFNLIPSMAPSILGHMIDRDVMIFYNVFQYLMSYSMNRMHASEVNQSLIHNLDGKMIPTILALWEPIDFLEDRANKETMSRIMSAKNTFINFDNNTVKFPKPVTGPVTQDMIGMDLRRLGY